MQSKFKKLFALMLAAGLAVSITACDDTDEEEEDSEEESVEETTENPDFETVESEYTLKYDPDKIPDALAEVICQYFYAIYTQDYDLYEAQINPTYFEAMDATLEEEYGYGMETDFESYHEALIDYAGTEDFTITEITMELADEALEDSYDESTDFVEDYLDAYSDFLGEDFVTEIEENTDEIIDVCMMMYGEDADGETITIMDQLEILTAYEDGAYGVLG